MKIIKWFIILLMVGMAVFLVIAPIFGNPLMILTAYCGAVYSIVWTLGSFVFDFNDWFNSKLKDKEE